MGKRNINYLQMTAYVLIAVIFIFIIGATRDCGRINYETHKGLSGGDTLDIALLYGPGSYYIYSDSLAGINHDVALKFSEETGTPIKIWAITDPNDGMNKLEKQNFDILASMPLDNNIKKRFPVSESIFLDRLVLVQLQDSLTKQKPINSSLDISGKTIYVASGSSAAQRIKNLAREIGGNIEIIEEPELSDELLTLKVANGSIPFAVVNEKVAKTLAETYPDLNYDSSVSFTQFQVWLFSPQDSLNYKKFNEWFENFRQSENYRTIIDNF